MDINDRSDPNVQGSSPGTPFLHPDWAHGSDPGQPAGASSGTARCSIIRELAIRWWRVLLLWLLVSIPTSYFIYTFIEPTYQAESLLRVEPTAEPVYSPNLLGSPNMSEVRPYLRTQFQLMRSDRVLDPALARPEINRLPMIRSSKDPKATLRRELHVSIVGDDTYLIEVALASRDPAEAAAIVNAVVEEYLEQHTRYQQTSNRALSKALDGEREKLESQIATMTGKLKELVSQGVAPVLMPRVDKPAGKGQDEPVVSSLLAVTEPQFVEMTSRLIHADFDLMDAQARLEAASLPGSEASAKKIRELESAVAEVKLRRSSYARYVAQVKLDSKAPNAQSLEASLLSQDLQHLKQLHQGLKSKLAQIEFEIGHEAYRITVQDKAAVPTAPANDKRLIYMAGASVVLLFLVIGLSLLEITARRVAAADAAS